MIAILVHAKVAHSHVQTNTRFKATSVAHHAGGNEIVMHFVYVGHQLKILSEDLDSLLALL